MNALRARLTGLLTRYRPRTSDTGGGKHRAGRTQKVDASHLLTPAAQQLATGTTKQIPAGPDEATGFWKPCHIHPTGHFTTFPKEER